MRHHITHVIAFLLLVAVAELSFLAPTSAGGGGSNIMSSPGYQRALKDSRKQYRDSYAQTYKQPYTQPPSVYSGKIWRNRGRR